MAELSGESCFLEDIRKLRYHLRSASYKDSKVVEMSPANISYTGSVEPENLRARFRTPVEVGWQWMAKLDHDFIGRKALEKEMSNPQKMIVSFNLESGRYF